MDLVSLKSMRTWKFASALAVAGVACIGSVAGCGGKTSSLSTDENPDPFLLMINASPDLGAADFYADNDKIVANAPYAPGLPELLQFLQLPFKEEEAGTYDLAVRQVNSADEIDVIAPALERNTDTLSVALGLFNPDTTVNTEEAKRLRLIEVEVDRKAPNGNRANLIVVHGYMRAKGSDTPSMKFQTPGRNPQFKTDSMEFGETKVLGVDAGTWTFEAKRGDVPDGTVFVSRSAEVKGGNLYIVIVSGIEDAADPNQKPSITFVQVPTRN